MREILAFLSVFGLFADFGSIGKHEELLLASCAKLKERTTKFVSGEGKPGTLWKSQASDIQPSLLQALAGMHMVIVRGLKMNLPPVIGDIEPIRKSKESQKQRDP